MGGHRRRYHRRQKFVSLQALDGQNDISKLVKEAKSRAFFQGENRHQPVTEAVNRAMKDADGVTELFVSPIPSGTSAEFLSTYFRTMLEDVGFSVIGKPSVLRCEILKSHKVASRKITAFLCVRTLQMATYLLTKSPCHLKTSVGRYRIWIKKSTRVVIPGIGSAWSTGRDPGAKRWKVGTVHVGEKRKQDEFSSFWRSSPIFDLAENSHVEINPVAKVLAVTIGRACVMLQADENLLGFNRTSSMMRIEIPFRSIRKSPTMETLQRAKDSLAVFFSISQPPSIFRSQLSTSESTGHFWDYIGGRGFEIRWVRTVDPTKSLAFCRARGILLMMEPGRVNTFFKHLQQMCIADKGIPKSYPATSRAEGTVPNVESMFQLAAERYNLSFSVRYHVASILSLSTISVSSLSPEFWRSLSEDLSEKDALATLDYMQFCLANENPNSEFEDPCTILRNCITALNIGIRSLDSDDNSIESSLSASDIENSRRNDLRNVELPSSNDAGGNEDDDEPGNELKLSTNVLSNMKITDSAQSSTVIYENQTSSQKQSRQHADIRRLIYTPTRTVVLRGENDLLNRVLRAFPLQEDRFLRVSFCDEDSDSIAFAGSDDLYARIRIALRDGVKCAGETFVFLAFSNSQLRDHAAWMYNETPSKNGPKAPSADEIRSWMGDFSHIRVPGKYAARQGQAFSSTIGTFVLEDVQEDEIEEVYTQERDYAFSDGIGVMSSSLAVKVARKLRIPPHKIPSAFQVRYGGAKGMLTVWDEVIPRGKRGTVEVALRKSMKKFQSTHRALEVVGYSKRLPLFLNRQIIVLLSGVGVQNEPFLKLQRRLLENLDKAMGRYGTNAALHLLYSSGFGESYAKLKQGAPMMNVAAFFRAGLTCVSCEHLFNMMYAFRRRTLKDLAARARIPIDCDKGFCAIGALDELGVLQPNEVFCQYTIPGSTRTLTVKGDVTVGRSPCLHPGDIRPLLAVDRVELRHLVDVIVFPKLGERPIPSMLSGGDLDGDIFFCIFDKTIAYPPKRPPDAMNYVAATPIELSHPVGTADVADFFVQYIKNDKLGQIANAHLVHSDREDISSHICLELAQLHSTAVDFAKTGVPARVRRDLLPRNRQGQYPDFMGKHNNVTYKSKKLLGQLYRACHSKTFEKEKEYTYFPNPNSCRMDSIINDIPVDEDVMQDARIQCNAYNFEIIRIMDEFGVNTEGEIVSGQIFSFANRHAQLRGRREYFSLVMRLNRQASELRNTFRDKFFQDLGQKPSEQYTVATISKACAWYKACSELVRADKEDKVQHLVSFPWVVSDVLLGVIRAEMVAEQQERDDMADDMADVYLGYADV